MLLSVKGLSVRVQLGARAYPAVEDVSFEVDKGESFGIVGESGCGKSLTALAILGLLSENLHTDSGTVLFEGQNLLDMPREQLDRLRGGSIAAIFQDATDNLNPLLPVGRQILDVVRAHGSRSHGASDGQVSELLERVHLMPAARIARQYPHQLSGGQRQRVMIAMAIAARPRLIIADEPTTALDLTTQSSILALLKQLQTEYGMGLILISHDITVIRSTCGRMAVMYAGRLAETGTVSELFDHPAHPYTRGLIGSVPTATLKGKPLPFIEGLVPPLESRDAAGCRFLQRCPCSTKSCATAVDMAEPTAGHLVFCNRTAMGGQTDG